MDEPSGTRTSTEITEPPSPSRVESVTASIHSRLEETPPTRPAKSESRLQHASSGTNDSFPPPANEAVSNFWLSHSDQAIFAVILLVTLVLLAAYWVRVTRWGTVPIEID